jgi:hypothetical protein
MPILLFQIEYGPNIESLPVCTRRFISLTLELTVFSLFRPTLKQSVYGFYMCLDFSGFIFIRNDTVTPYGRKELNKI